jgi:hypothetical protein
MTCVGVISPASALQNSLNPAWNWGAGKGELVVGADLLHRRREAVRVQDYLQASGAQDVSRSGSIDEVNW